VTVPQTLSHAEYVTTHDEGTEGVHTRSSRDSPSLNVNIEYQKCD
jgi:hypothetical protein